MELFKTRRRSLKKKHLSRTRIDRKMAKQSKNIYEQNSLVDDNEWVNHPVAEWVSLNRQNILWGLIALLALLVISFRIVSWKTSNAEAAYYKAQTVFNQFQKNPILADQSGTATPPLTELESMMQSYPELHAKYDGPLAQTLLAVGQLPTADQFAQATFKRTKDDFLKPFHQFSATSFFIQEGKFDDAYQQSKQLKEELDAANSNVFENTLYIYNLIRMAMLGEQLGLEKEEKEIWSVLQSQFAGSDEMKRIFQTFQIGETGLDKYLLKRLEK